MKIAFGFLVFVWMMCGLIGAWWLDDLNVEHWKVIVKGPITLVRAYNDYQPNYPGPS